MQNAGALPNYDLKKSQLNSEFIIKKVTFLSGSMAKLCTCYTAGSAASASESVASFSASGTAASSGF